MQTNGSGTAHGVGPGNIAPRAALKVARFWPLVSSAIGLGLVVLLGVIIVLRPQEQFAVDAEWMEEVLEHRSPFWTAPALLMNYLGGGIVAVVVVPVLTIAALLVFRRPWAALYYVCAALLATGVIQALKATVGRARPTDILVTSDVGAFPSGHAANAAMIAMSMAIIFPRLWVWGAGAAYTVIMMLSRTYLGAHWISDTVGGLIVGVGVAIIVWAPFAYKLMHEGHRPHHPLWRS